MYVESPAAISSLDDIGGGWAEVSVILDAGLGRAISSVRRRKERTLFRTWRDQLRQILSVSWLLAHYKLVTTNH